MRKARDLQQMKMNRAVEEYRAGEEERRATRPPSVSPPPDAAAAVPPKVCSTRPHLSRVMWGGRLFSP